MIGSWIDVQLAPTMLHEHLLKGMHPSPHTHRRSRNETRARLYWRLQGSSFTRSSRPTLTLRSPHTQGEVVLQAVIGKDGTIQNLHVVSGHPMLIKSAADAVQQWRYRPYMLNGEPVEVETQVRVSFTIS